jgi:asparagine synthase (glutamine-hydrolysing)
MAERLRHRGPDGHDTYVNGPVGFAHTRLAIQDPNGGAQPLTHEETGVTICYNGEIYNSPALRDELIAKGYRFRSTSDTEVILVLYLDDPKGFVARLDGIFSFAIWDPRSQRMVLARDYIGVKPLYFWHNASKLVFGSEVKALLVDPDVPCKPDMKAFAEILRFQNIHGTRTCFQDIDQVAPGEIVTVEASGTVSNRAYWSFNPGHQLQGSRAGAAEQLRELVKDTVTAQLLSDVPIASYLSGGMDTGSITAIARPHLGRLHTFSGGFDLNNVAAVEHGVDERTAAEMMSKHFDTQHHFHEITSNDLLENFSSIGWHLEEPRGSTCYAPYVMAREAGAYVKVILSGHGGDELFAGYQGRYAYAVDPARDWETSWYTLINHLISDADAPSMLTGDLAGNELLDWPREVFQQQVASTARMSRLKRSQHHDLFTYMQGLLAIEDKLSMAHSLESRVPLLGREIFDLAWQIPDKWKMSETQGKLVFRDAMQDIVPDDIRARGKMGFGPPDNSYYRGPLKDFFEEMILGGFVHRGMVREDACKEALASHMAGAPKANVLWTFASIESWMQRFVDGEADLREGNSAGPVQLTLSNATSSATLAEPEISDQVDGRDIELGVKPQEGVTVEGDTPPVSAPDIAASEQAVGPMSASRASRTLRNTMQATRTGYQNLIPAHHRARIFTLRRRARSGLGTVRQEFEKGDLPRRIQRKIKREISPEGGFLAAVLGNKGVELARAKLSPIRHRSTALARKVGGKAVGKVRHSGSNVVGRAKIRIATAKQVGSKATLKQWGQSAASRLRKILVPDAFVTYTKTAWHLRSGAYALSAREKYGPMIGNMAAKSPVDLEHLRVFHGLYSTVQPRFLVDALNRQGHNAVYETFDINPGYAASDHHHSTVYHPDLYYEHVRWSGTDIQLRAIPVTDTFNISTLETFFERQWPNYDAYHFNWFLSFLPDGADVELLRDSGKQVYFHFRGCFILTKIISEFAERGESVADACAHCKACGWRDQYFERFHRAETHASRIFVSTPNLLHCSDDFEYFPLSLEPNLGSLEYRARFDGSDRDEVIIMHAPSSAAMEDVKGTRFVKRAVEELQAEGYKIDLQMIQNMPRQEAIAKYATADIFVEQLCLGAYGNTAIEAMASGVPVISSLHPTVAHAAPNCPVVHADPTTVKDRIRELIDAKDKRDGLGRAGYEFVRDFHGNVNVVARMLEAYTADLEKFEASKTPRNSPYGDVETPPESAPA